MALTQPTTLKKPALSATTLSKVTQPAPAAPKPVTATGIQSGLAAARPATVSPTATKPVTAPAGAITQAKAAASPAQVSSGTAAPATTFPYVASNGKTYNITSAQIPALESALTGQNYAGGTGGGAAAPVGSGITGGVQQTQFTGMDMTQPGAAEEFFRNTGYRYELPNDLTEQGSYWQQTMGQVASPGVGEQTFASVAPELRAQGTGERQVDAITGAYSPGNYPTGTNFTEQALTGAKSAQPGSLNQQGTGELAYNALTGTYELGNTPTGTNRSGTVADSYNPTALGKGGGEDMAAFIASIFQPGSTPGASNRADEFYQQFLGQMPDLKSDPGLQPYYDRARQKAAEDINRQMAARGMWGSSAAGGMIGEAMTDLGAEQATREAEYYLNMLAERRGWQDTGGQLAGSADSSSRGQAANELAWTQGLAGIANEGQELELARAGENREQTALSGALARSADDVSARQGQDERAWADMLTGFGMDAQGLGLQRTGQQLDWQNLFGDLATRADANSLAKSQNELGWATGMGELGLQGDAQNLARLQALLGGGTDAQSQQLQRLGLGADITQNIDLAEIQRLQAGQNAATAAQNAQRARGQDYFNNSMGIGTAMEGVMTGQLNPLIDADKTSLDDILAMLTGSGAERLAGAQRQTAGANQVQQQTQEATMAAIARMLTMM